MNWKEVTEKYPAIYRRYFKFFELENKNGSISCQREWNGEGLSIEKEIDYLLNYFWCKAHKFSDGHCSECGAIEGVVLFHAKNLLDNYKNV